MTGFETALMMGAGGRVASGIGDMFGGGQQREDQGFGRALLKSLVGKNLYDPKQVVGQARNTFYKKLKEMMGGYEDKFDLDQGRGMGEMMFKWGQLEPEMLMQHIVRNAEGKRATDVSAGLGFYGGGK